MYQKQCIIRKRSWVFETTVVKDGGALLLIEQNSHFSISLWFTYLLKHRSMSRGEF